jgi:endonuclease/exonuclease/phosphatase family metal-dependent hydrolase
MTVRCRWAEPDVWLVRDRVVTADELKASFWKYVAINLSSTSQRFFPSKSPTTLRVATWNVHYWSDVYLRPTFPYFLKDLQMMDADVVCLQEVNFGGPTKWLSLNREQLLAIFRLLGYAYWHFCGTTNFHGAPFGNLTLSRMPMNSTNLSLGQDPIHKEVRCLTRSEILLPNKSVVTVLNIHADVWDTTEATRVKQMKIVLQVVVAEPRDRPVVVCGDFNSTHPSDYDYYPQVWNWIVQGDKRRGLMTQTTAQRLLKSNLVSAFSASDSAPPPATVWSNRIVDYIYLNSTAAARTIPQHTMPFFSLASDHIPLFTDLSISSST